MDKIAAFKVELDKNLHDPKKPWARPLAFVEQKTGINRVYLVLCGSAGTACWLVFGVAAQLLCNIIGFVYPAYASIHAIESPRKVDDRQWLTYWVAFALFSVAEYYADIIVKYVPCYWLLKCIFMIWMNRQGSGIIYRNIIRPVFLKHHGPIDSVLNSVKGAVSQEDVD